MKEVLEKCKKVGEQDRSNFLELLIAECIAMTSRSPDLSTKVGCVIFDPKTCRILGQGYNGEVMGGVPRAVSKANFQSFSQVLEFFEERGSLPTESEIHFFQMKKNGANIEVGVERSVYDQITKERKESKRLSASFRDNHASSTGADCSIHAEMNALLFSENPRSMFRDSVAVVSLMPCPQCYKLLSQVQVGWVIVLSDSGKYLRTLREMVNNHGPKIITLDYVKELLAYKSCIPECRVFKESKELARVISYSFDIPFAPTHELDDDSYPDVRYKYVKITYEGDEFRKQWQSLQTAIFRMRQEE